jgi:hypothetical protein
MSEPIPETQPAAEPPAAPAAPKPLEPQENPLTAVEIGGSGNLDYADPDD